MTHPTTSTTRIAGRFSVRHLAVVLLAVAIALVALLGPTPSSAIFTSGSSAGGQVAAAPDWTPPTVSVTAPGAWVKGLVTVEIAASDSEGPVDRVVLEGRAGAATWATVCTDTSSPFSCALDTRGLADGEYELRARATDRAGLESTSAIVRTTVANQTTVVVTAPGTQLRGTVTLTGSVANIGTLAHTVRLQHASPGSSTWTTICTDLRSPYTCSWDTGGVPAGGRDLRAVVVGSDGRTVTTSAVVTVTVDNVAPSIALADPGSPLSGTRTFSTTASDAHTGVKRVVVQSAPNGSSVWSDLCTVSASPWNCQVATGALADGNHSFRAVATDGAGNTATSTVVANRLVENTAPAVTLTALPATLTGTVQVGATASSVPGVTSVKVQYQRSGTTAWTDICTDTAAPYACGWNTMSLANGTYALHAVMVDALGRTTTSALLTRQIENRPFTGVDVQTFNGAGNTSGRPDNGDGVLFTFSHEVDPATVMPGWDGTSRTVTARFNDSAPTIFIGTKEDTLEVLTANGSTVNLGKVIVGDYIRASRTTEFDSTLTASTVTAPDGTVRTVVTLTLGAPQFGGLTGLHSANNADPGHMIWTPSALVKDVYGRFCSPAPVTETGPLDREF
ncbi:Ig-like domain-containing protein [Nocardioides gilvus]|uniref:Ig-like domain-containing protein n=1 Tax=Nocardioides gilvus TaxID=1735589 RepID=UPI000D746BF3|nr:Ig-like domain-containing protein [Nocardioides gilvus]